MGCKPRTDSQSPISPTKALSHATHQIAMNGLLLESRTMLKKCTQHNVTHGLGSIPKTHREILRIHSLHLKEVIK